MNIKNQNFKLVALLILTSLTLQISTSVFSQSVGIGGDCFSIDASALLELQDTTKGFLMTRLTTTQRDAISSPADGLIIFNTTTKCYEGYVGSSWTSIACYDPCGGITTLTDSRDSNAYPTVAIGSQCWMAKNLAYLPMVHDNTTFNSRGGSSLAAYGVYDYNGSVVATAKVATNYSKYGVLYNWWAVMVGSSSCNGTGESQPACSTPVQGVCPSGWHLPSHHEFTALERAVCSSGNCAVTFPYDATTMYFLGTDEAQRLADNEKLWLDGLLDVSGAGISPFGTSGFSVLPGGYRKDNDGSFSGETRRIYLWSSTDKVADAWVRDFMNYDRRVYRTYINKKAGLSVRCVKDN